MGLNTISERKSAASHTPADPYLVLFARVIQTGHSLVVMEIAEWAVPELASGGWERASYQYARH